MDNEHSRKKKSLTTMSEGEEGVVTAIWGPAALHRRLLHLGITAGIKLTRVIKEAVCPSDALPFRVGTEVVYVPVETAGNIRIIAGRTAVEA